MAACKKWLKEAIDELRTEIEKGSFFPLNERDLQCHLYHLLLPKTQSDPKLAYAVCSEYPLEKESRSERPRKFDLAIMIKHGHNVKPQARLLIEIKDTNKKFTKKNVAKSEEWVHKKVEEDVQKLCKHSSGLERKRDLDHLRKSVILFVFREVADDAKEEIKRNMSIVRKRLQDEFRINLQWIILPHELSYKD